MEPSTPQASVSSLTLPGKSERLRPPLPPRAADLAFPDSGLPSPASPPPAWPSVHRVAKSQTRLNDFTLLYLLDVSY